MKLSDILVCLIACTVTASAADQSSLAEAVVQRQVDAYNARDLDAFAATYANDVKLFEFPDKLLASGQAQLRQRYAERFKEPNLHAIILKRISMGNTIVDHEEVTRTFPEGAGSLEAIAIYELQDGKIAKAWLVLGAKKVDDAPAK